jgi:hypothetical protein
MSAKFLARDSQLTACTDAIALARSSLDGRSTYSTDNNVKRPYHESDDNPLPSVFKLGIITYPTANFLEIHGSGLEGPQKLFHFCTHPPLLLSVLP